MTRSSYSLIWTRGSRACHSLHSASFASTSARLSTEMIDRRQIDQHVERELGIELQPPQALACAGQRYDHGGVAALRMGIEHVAAEQPLHTLDQVVRRGHDGRA